MKAVRVHQLGGPEGLKVEELPEPKAGPGEVVVRVRATSLNFRDLLMIRGQYNPRIGLPFVPLSDGAGEVLEVGSGVTPWKPGDRVAAAFMPGWVSGSPSDAKAHSALGGGGAGMLTEKIALPADGIVPIPAHLSFEEAATLPCAAVTAWHALVTEGEVRAGQTVLVQGTGGVSIFALQLARLNGARVIVTSSSDEKLAKALTLGASDGVNYKTSPEWDKNVRELTGGEGVDHVIEVGGAGTLGRSLKAAKTGGRISMIGVLSGGSAELPIFPILMKNLRVQGVFVGSVEMFEAMNRAIALHKLVPVIDRIFPFDETRAAFEHIASGAHFGKVVIRV